MSRQLYPSGASGTEIDLRSEFEQMMSGSAGEIPKQQKLVFRQMRRDANDELLECSCVSILTKEADTEDQCPFCFGERYYWNESFVYGYVMHVGSKGGYTNKRVNMQPGVISAYDKVFYLRYSETITYDDKIIELKLDSEGKPVVPYRRKMIFRPETIMEMRSDYGRIEFIAVYVNENNGIRVK